MLDAYPCDKNDAAGLNGIDKLLYKAKSRTFMGNNLQRLNPNRMFAISLEFSTWSRGATNRPVNKSRQSATNTTFCPNVFFVFVLAYVCITQPDMLTNVRFRVQTLFAPNYWTPIWRLIISQKKLISVIWCLFHVNRFLVQLADLDRPKQSNNSFGYDGFSAPLNRLNAILSLLHPLDPRYRLTLRNGTRLGGAISPHLASTHR